MYEPQGIREAFDSALTRYLTNLMQVSATLAETQRLAMREQTEAGAAAASSNAGNTHTKEYDELIAAIQSQDASRIASAQSGYLNSVQAPRQDAAEAGRAALAQYLAKVQAAWEAAQAESRSSFAVYVMDVKNAFARLDPGAVDATALAAIGQTVTTAAIYAGGSMPSLPASPQLLQDMAAAR